MEVTSDNIQSICHSTGQHELHNKSLCSEYRHVWHLFFFTMFSKAHLHVPNGKKSQTGAVEFNLALTIISCTDFSVGLLCINLT